MNLKPLIILIPWSTSFHNVEHYVNFFFQFLDLGRLWAVLAFWRSPSRELKKVSVKIKLMLACHAELWEWGAGNISCASLPELRAGCTPTSIFFIIFIYYFFFDFARRTSPKSRDYSWSIICVMFGKVNGKSYCKLIVGRASLDVFIKYKNMLLLFLSRYFYARSKTDDFFLYFLLL